MPEEGGGQPPTEAAAAVKPEAVGSNVSKKTKPVGKATGSKHQKRESESKISKVSKASKPLKAESLQGTKSAYKKEGSVGSVSHHITSVRSEVSMMQDSETWGQPRAMLRPEDQLVLTEAELSEDIARVLTQVNPQVSENIVQYSFKEYAFVRVPHPGHTVILLDIESESLHLDSDEARLQLMGVDGLPVVPDEDEGLGKDVKGGEEEPPPEEEAKPEEAAAAVADESEVEKEAAPAEGGEGDADDEEHGASGPKKVINQFNFSERAALTYNNPYRDMETQTPPIDRETLAQQIYQYTIYDAYEKDQADLQFLKDKDKTKKEVIAVPPIIARRDAKRKKTDADIAEGKKVIRLLRAAKTLERMVNLNIFDEIAKDYRFWEDAADQYMEDEGTLLPLWKFSYEKTNKKCVTDLCWNPRYYDLFAVAFGSFDFISPEPEGGFCLFTLKNPSYPEYVCITETGVMCVDIHPIHSYLVCVGFNDGNVAVYDVLTMSHEPTYKCNSLINKHAGVTWQVKWGPDTVDNEMNFYSVGSDGYVFNWGLLQKELAQITIISMVLDLETTSGPDGIMVLFRGTGTTFAFHPTDPLTFIVGTEEGSLYKCCSAYASKFLFTYEGHHMPIHRINYNKYCPEIFITCSSDRRVKIWDDNSRSPLFVFDLGSPVGDVEWAPYTSTVFGATTLDGNIHIFDISINKYKPLCIQLVVSRRKYKLTRMAFNQRMPVVICGDDKGNIRTLKLSPNLRKTVKQPKKGPPVEPRELEIQKLLTLLSYVREPEVLERPPDIPLRDDV